MKKAVCFLILVSFLLMPAAAFAASPWTEGETYADKLSGKLEFGIKNTLLGWTDIIAEPNKAATEGRDTMVAMGKAFSDAFLNTLGGVAHLITFPVTNLDIPLPDNGIDL